MYVHCAREKLVGVVVWLCTLPAVCSAIGLFLHHVAELLRERASTPSDSDFFPSVPFLFFFSPVSINACLSLLSQNFASRNAPYKTSRSPGPPPLASSPLSVHSSKSVRSSFRLQLSLPPPLRFVAVFCLLENKPEESSNTSARALRVFSCFCLVSEAVNVICLLSEHVIATGDDGGFVSLWDVREEPGNAKSFKKLDRPVMRFHDHDDFVSGTSPLLSLPSLHARRPCTHACTQERGVFHRRVSRRKSGETDGQRIKESIEQANFLLVFTASARESSHWARPWTSSSTCMTRILIHL